MTDTAVKYILKQKLDEIAANCKCINTDMDAAAIAAFRNNVRVLRSFMRMVRLHRGSWGMRMPVRYKKMFAIACELADINNALQDLADHGLTFSVKYAELHKHLAEYQANWKNTFNQRTLDKLEKQLLGFDYSMILPAILNNFFSTHQHAGGYSEEPAEKNHLMVSI